MAMSARGRGGGNGGLPSKRRRRSREAAAAEIVAAAEELLRERPFRDLSVDELMARTSLSRSSFYVYFRDRYDVLLRIVQTIGDELLSVSDRELAGEPRETVRAALERAVGVYAEHGLVARAISDASSVDPAVERVYSALIQRFIDQTIGHLQREAVARRLSPLHDPAETAFALVWMTERYLNQSLGTPAPRVSRQTAVSTLQELWVRALYERA